MKLALDYATIMARMYFGSPVIVLVTVPNSTNIFPLDCIGRTLLGREYLFRPAFDHRNATIQDAFRFAHFRNTTMQVSRKIVGVKYICPVTASIRTSDKSRYLNEKRRQMVFQLPPFCLFNFTAAALLRGRRVGYELRSIWNAPAGDVVPSLRHLQ